MSHRKDHGNYHDYVQRALDAEAEVDRLHSWQGLLTLLDEHWPEETFPTLADDAKRDTGPRLVSALRRALKAEAAIERVEALTNVLNRTVHADHRDPLGMVKVSDLLAALAVPADGDRPTDNAPRRHGPECACRELHHEPACPVNVAWLAQREREAASHA